jgi:acetoin utilization protein AcuB
MLVKNWMSEPVITVDVNDSIQHSMSLLKQHKIRILPVMKKGKLIGIVTDRDLKKASASDANTLDVRELSYIISKIKVKEIMTHSPITVPFDYTIEETAEILLSNKISGVPVVDKNRQVVGVITQSDLFKVIISLTGYGRKGIQFAFKMKDQSGSITIIAEIIQKYGRIASILTSYEDGKSGYRKVYIRIYGFERTELTKLKEELKKKATLYYMIDHRENMREIY